MLLVAGVASFRVFPLASKFSAQNSAAIGTYRDNVGRIFREKCEGCHRAGGDAPFSLETYTEVHAKRERIRNAIRAGRMPPWFANPEFGEWANDRSLTLPERREILDWIALGAPEGDSDATLPREQSSRKWSIGTPDVVLRLGEPVRVRAGGIMPYQYAYVKTDFAEDKWVKAIQIRPTNPQVLHHALVLIEDPLDSSGPAATPRLREQIDRAMSSQNSSFGEGLDGYFAAYVPGHSGVVYSAGQARLLPRGATLKLQLHYAPGDFATYDQTEIGLVFDPDEPDQLVETAAAVNMDFMIPPGAKNYAVSATFEFVRPSSLVGFLPHMHLRGKAFRYDLIYPDGNKQTVLDIPHFDFRWQEEYMLNHPLSVPAGTILRATGWYDNSSKNPYNPDPTAPVFFGEQTYEEMMNGYFSFLVDNPH